MVPLGPLKTARPEVMEQYKTIADRYDGTVYRNMIVAGLEGVAPYNRYINHTPPYKWVIHPNWLVIAPRMAACWGEAMAASPSIRQKTTSSSRAFREH